MDLRLEGVAPFTINYEVLDLAGNRTAHQAILDENTTSLQIGPFSVPGSYRVHLSLVTDNTRCNRPLKIDGPLVVSKPLARLICGGDRRVLKTKRGAQALSLFLSLSLSLSLSLQQLDTI